MIKAALILAVLGAPTAAQAAPVYLSCTFENASPITATADESQSVVTIMVDGTPAPQRLNAAFSPGVVTFGNTMISYTLDRQTLALIRKVHQYGWTEHGQCKLQKVPKRAF